jgi:hypothetical protein
VGDSTEQNGCFKIALTKAKQALVTEKNDNNLPYEINKTDVVKLVKEAWAVSFAHEETNRKAILNRGWGSKALNYKCLTPPRNIGIKAKRWYYTASTKGIFILHCICCIS